MYSTLIVFPSLISFIITYFLIKRWIKIARRIGMVGKDMNKKEHPLVAEGGGTFVILGSSIGLLVYIFILVYVMQDVSRLPEIFAIITILLLTGLLGLFDDLLGWKRGLSPIEKPLYLVLLSLPIVVIKAGCSMMSLPLIGQVNFGLLYPLLLVPIGIAGAANGFNMLAGYNGLEGIMGIILLLSAGIVAYSLNLSYLSAISIIISSSILAFLIFNWYPAKVFPGNSFTHAIGAIYATIVILGNFEKIGVLLFSLYFLELILFLRGLRDGVYKENFGIPDERGCLKEPYEKCYSVTHLAIKVLRRFRGCAREKEVVIFIASIQITLSIIVLFTQVL